MELGLIVGLCSLVVSAGSPAYAHSALQAAREANRVGLHQTHKAMFDALLDFRSLFVALDLHPVPEEMDRFYRGFVGPAHLYLPHDLVDRSYSIYKRGRELFEIIERAGTPEGVTVSHP